MNLRQFILLILTVSALLAEAVTLGVGSVSSQAEQRHGLPESSAEPGLIAAGIDLSKSLPHSWMSDGMIGGLSLLYSSLVQERPLAAMMQSLIPVGSFSRHRLFCVDLR